MVINKKKEVLNMKERDNFVYYNCVSGNCPLIIEEERYGVRTSTCKEYCKDNSFSGCNNCYFEGSDICNECIHKEADNCYES